MHPWEALFEIFLIFRDPLGAGGAPFWLKKTSFLRSDFLIQKSSNKSLHFGGVGGISGPPGRLDLARYS